MTSNAKYNLRAHMIGFSTDLFTVKTLLITGAGKGIGRACAKLAAQLGANVIAVQGDFNNYRLKGGN